MSEYLIPTRVKVQLVRESQPKTPSHSITNIGDVSDLLVGYFCKLDREAFVTIHLSSNSKVLGVEIVTLGILNSSLVHPREVFKAAILNNAASIIIAHNHPSGNLNPSSEDQRITHQLIEAGEILGIKILDHVLFAGDQVVSLINK